MGRRIVRSPRKRPKQQRSKATFEAILQAGARVLVEEGYERASTNRIAEVAGVGIGSLYEFFPNKDAIFTELRRSLNDQMLAVVTRSMQEALELPVPEAVRKCVEVLVEAHSISPRLDSALKERVPQSAIADQDRYIERDLSRLGLAFAERHRHELRRQNLEVAVFVAIQTAESLTHEAAKRFPEKLQNGEILEEVSDLITRYLAKD
jgi:AcrR family transcriptional regulator